MNVLGKIFFEESKSHFVCVSSFQIYRRRSCKETNIKFLRLQGDAIESGKHAHPDLWNKINHGAVR